MKTLLGEVPDDDIIAVRALDGRWNYGPARLFPLLQIEEGGIYPDMHSAWHAGRKEAGQ